MRTSDADWGRSVVSPVTWWTVLVLALVAGCDTAATSVADASHAIDAADTDASHAIDAADTDASHAIDAADTDAVDTDAGDDGLTEPVTDACAIATIDTTNRRAAAACRAIDAFARGQFPDPFDLLAADVTARRFRVAALSGMWPSYRQALAQMPDLALRAYARVGDAGARLTAEDLAMLTGVDAFTGPALYCREHPLPTNFGSVLTDNLALGGYNATHVLLALMWLRDRACAGPTDDQFFETTLAVTASLIDQDHSLTTDLEMEAAALLTYVGAGSRVPSGFADGVLANQQAGGGWGRDSPTDTADGHTTALALWYLHELLFPDRQTPMVNSNVRTTTANSGP